LFLKFQPLGIRTDRAIPINGTEKKLQILRFVVASEHNELLQKLSQMTSAMKATEAYVKVRLISFHEGPEGSGRITLLFLLFL